MPRYELLHNIRFKDRIYPKGIIVSLPITAESEAILIEKRCIKKLNDREPDELDELMEVLNGGTDNGTDFGEGYEDRAGDDGYQREQ